jgi:iron complex outermembrane receptor protein
VLPDAITLIRNTGKMVSAGVELEGSAIPVRGLQLDYAFGITNARYRSLTVSSNGQSLDLKGKRQLFTPDRTGLIAMQYTIPLQRASNKSMIARAEWIHTGNIWFDLSNSIRQSAYSVLNARFGWMGKKAEIYCWGRNLSGKKFIAYAYDFGAIHLGDPRTFGITLVGKL